MMNLGAMSRNHIGEWGEHKSHRCNCNTVTLAAHARRGLIIRNALLVYVVVKYLLLHILIELSRYMGQFGI